MQLSQRSQDSITSHIALLPPSHQTGYQYQKQSLSQVPVTPHAGNTNLQLTSPCEFFAVPSSSRIPQSIHTRNAKGQQHPFMLASRRETHNQKGSREKLLFGETDQTCITQGLGEYVQHDSATERKAR